MSGAATLAIAELSAGYPSRPIIRGLSLPPIRAGRIVALVGPNGAGKSTLLRALAGLVPATGSARLDGLELVGCQLAARAGRVGFMPQCYPTNSALTVLESVVTALRAPSGGVARARGREQTRLRALATLDRIGIAELGLRPLDQLSGGQRQLASLAQAIVRGPDLLLLDEPTSALDLRHQIEVMELLRSLADEGRIVIVVLHDIGLAARWADEIVVLNRGAVHRAGAPHVALTPDSLAAVYGVRARVEPDPEAGLRITVDGTIGGRGGFAPSGAMHAERTGRA